jgi:hypothetical protein
MTENIADSPVDWNDVDYEGISEFLEKKGSVDFLAYLDGYGYRFEEIDNDLNLSRGYINDRRDEALNLDLIYPSQQDRDGTIRRVWALSPLGMVLVHKMRLNGLRSIQERLISLRNEYDDLKDEFIDWSDDPTDIEDFVEEVAKEAETRKKGSTFSFGLKSSLDPAHGLLDDTDRDE